MNLSVRKKLKRGGIFVLLAAIFCACAIPFFFGSGQFGKSSVDRRFTWLYSFYQPYSHGGGSGGIQFNVLHCGSVYEGKSRY